MKPIDTTLPERKLVSAINRRLKVRRMELVSAEGAVFGDVANFGQWFIRRHPAPNLVERFVDPLKLADTLNKGGFPG